MSLTRTPARFRATGHSLALNARLNQKLIAVQAAQQVRPRRQVAAPAVNLRQRNGGERLQHFLSSLDYRRSEHLL
jgi:hypothetical protein